MIYYTNILFLSLAVSIVQFFLPIALCLRLDHLSSSRSVLEEKIKGSFSKKFLANTNARGGLLF